MHTCSARAVLVEEIPGKEDEVHIGCLGDLQDLAKGVDGILASDGVLLRISNVIVSGQEYAKAAVDESVKQGFAVENAHLSGSCCMMEGVISGSAMLLLSLGSWIGRALTSPDEIFVMRQASRRSLCYLAGMNVDAKDI